MKKRVNKLQKLRCTGENFLFFGITLIFLVCIPMSVSLIVYKNPCVLFIADSENKESVLNFWGTYLAAVIAIGGIYWQVNRELRNSKEQEFNVARAFFLLNHKIESISTDSKIYFTDKTEDFNYKKDVGGKRLPFIVINNISDKPMLAIEIKIQSSEIEELCSISKIDKNEMIYLFSFGTEVAYDIATKAVMSYEESENRNSKINKALDNIVNITIFYTTELREKIKLVYKFDKAKEEFDYSRKYIESRGEDLNGEYNLSSFRESKYELL